MKYVNKGHIKRLLAVLLLCLVTAITINNVIYLHSHIVDENGTVVVHAHPFEKSADNLPFKKHSHTNFEYTITQGFGIFLLSSVVALTFITIVQKVQYYHFKEKLFKLAPEKTSLRGPPTLSLA